ncbi:chitinase [Pseudonocardiaceae bacterium YIM PH 21723]|nr:chitinase [Pseudonocardiaceae bacterium YIM PH 21723]
MWKPLAAIAAAAALVGGVTVLSVTNSASAADDQKCRPDGLAYTASVSAPYCQNYDENGREKLANGNSRRIIGYFTNWRTGANGTPKYLVNDIPWDKVTHINYAFAGIKNNKVSVGAESTDIDFPGVPGAELDPSLPYKGHFNLLTKYKKQHPAVKTLISIGGWADTKGFYELTTNADNSVNQAGINTFADSTVEFLRKYGFNGADIDYEYASSMKNAGNPDDFAISNARRAGLVKSYGALMKTLREKLDAASAQDGKYYELTAAVTASGWILRGAETYPVTQYLDFANLMTYDYQGAWNQFVAPNSALYDDGKNNELVNWNYYTTAQYGGLGYQNSDWAYHYFRGAMQAGRINIGTPFYTRGWKDVQGGTDGLYGKAPLPDQTQCPAGTGASVGSTVPCGNGASGIDNLWHDYNSVGAELPSGSNPMWHAKNLEKGITGDYLASYGVTEPLKGSYVRKQDDTLVTSWLWNADKKVFLSTEDEQTIAKKAKYVVDKGIGGIMFWELAGDYKLDQAKNQYVPGDTMVSTIFDTFKGASPYGNLKAKTAQPTETLNVATEFTGFKLGDENYPINPKLKITNNSDQDLPGGTEFQFDYGAQSPASMTDQSGFGTKVINSEHSGPGNVGGIKGDFNRVSVSLPGWQTLAKGQSVEITLNYYLPIATPINWTVKLGGKLYALAQDYPRGTTASVPTTSVPTTNSSAPQACTGTAGWSADAVYTGGQVVSYAGHTWKAKWWTKGEQPDKSGVWADQGACS